jgi:hypothetical protein
MLGSYSKMKLKKIINYNKIQNERSKFGVYPFRFDDLRCIFIHIPRTGGVSVCKSIFNNLAGGHKSFKEYKYIFGKNYEDYFKFSFVRNPFDRLYSSYNFLKQGGLGRADLEFLWSTLEKYDSFDRFVKEGLPYDNEIKEKVHFLPQVKFIYNDRRDLEVDFVGYFENFQTDFSKVIKRLNLDSNLAHLNNSKPEYSSIQVFDNEMKEIVYHFYKEDFIYLNYFHE